MKNIYNEIYNVDRGLPIISLPGSLESNLPTSMYWHFLLEDCFPDGTMKKVGSQIDEFKRNTGWVKLFHPHNYKASAYNMEVIFNRLKWPIDSYTQPVATTIEWF